MDEMDLTPPAAPPHIGASPLPCPSQSQPQLLLLRPLPPSAAPPNHRRRPSPPCPTTSSSSASSACREPPSRRSPPSAAASPTSSRPTPSSSSAARAACSSRPCSPSPSPTTPAPPSPRPCSTSAQASRRTSRSPRSRSRRPCIGGYTIQMDPFASCFPAGERTPPPRPTVLATSRSITAAEDCHPLSTAAPPASLSLQQLHMYHILLESASKRFWATNIAPQYDVPAVAWCRDCRHLLLNDAVPSGYFCHFLGTSLQS